MTNVASRSPRPPLVAVTRWGFVLALLLLLGCVAARAQQGDYESYRRDAENQLRAGGWYVYIGDMVFDEAAYRDVANSTYAAGGYDASTWLTQFNRTAIDALIRDVRRRRSDVARFLDTYRREIFTTLATAVRAKTYSAYANEFVGCGVITRYTSRSQGGGYGDGYGDRTGGGYGGGYGGGRGHQSARYQIYMRVKAPSGGVTPGPGPNPYPNPYPPAPSSGPTYFNWQGTAYFSPDGRTYFAFTSPQHLAFFRNVVKGNDAGLRDKNQFGTYGGFANLPEGYFTWNATVWYTDGKGNIVGMTSVPALLNHQATHPNAARWGQLDVDPHTFMRQTGTY